jgi:hypothetical protein
MGNIIFLLNNQFDDCPSVDRHSEDNIMNNIDSLKLINYNNEDEITFNPYSRSYCMCIIRIVDYRQNADKLKNPFELRTYYSIFFNTMVSIIIHHGGKVIKNIEDGLLFYFPQTVSFSKVSSFQNVLDCGLAMIEANSIKFKFQ